ncbi:ATP-binding protein [Polyangium sp. y55x31]|uniref:ATP-binding protein n=1 Tax=Polyangium sp. y55x31 TaxID=3042688 RepID=UPI0024832A68|nr:ATP-binding protein [Polyangium sp. y55x31]MDI1481338.1 ATP-binding protein [Polyangium sp. y55x31]
MHEKASDLSAQAAESTLREMLGGHGSGLSLLDSLGAIVWLADGTDLSLSFLNRKARALLGLARSDVSPPSSVLSRVPHEDQAHLREVCNAVAATGTSRPVDYRIVGGGGQLVPLSGHVHAVRAESGEALVALAFVGIARPEQEPANGLDGARNGKEAVHTIGEPLSVRRAARLSRIEDIIDNIDGIVWEVDADTFRFSYVSAHAEQILGYPAARWIEDPTFWMDHIHPDDLHWCMALCKDATARGVPHRFEYRMIAADGRVVWLRDYVRVVLEDGRPARLRGVMVDITEVKHVQAELEKTISLLRTTLESTADGILVTASDGSTINAYNQQFVQMWRVPLQVLEQGSDEQALATVIDQLAEPDAFYAKLRWLYAYPEEECHDFVAFKDGRLFERYSRPQRLGREVIGRVFSFRDVTRRFHAEAERDRLLVEERRLRGEAERAHGRMAFLAEASRKLAAAALDVEPMLAAVVTLAVPALARWCAIVLPEGIGVNDRPTAAAAHDSASIVDCLCSLLQRSPPGPDDPIGFAEVMRTGEPLLAPSVPDQALRAAARDEAHLALLRALGATPRMLVPLMSKGRAIGVLALGAMTLGAHFSPEDQALVEEFGRRCATALENTRLYGEAQEALRRKEESLALLDTLFTTAPVGLAFLDTDMRYVRSNRALAVDIHRRSPEDEVGMTLHQAIPELAPRVERYIRHVLDTGEPLVGVEVSARVPGSPDHDRHWLASYYPVRTVRGDLLGVGVVVVDMTEQKRAEEVRARLYQDAQEAIRVRDDFLSIASHELKTPLATLTLRLEQMARRLRDGLPVDKEPIARALAQVGRLTALTNDLLDVSRIAAGRLTIRAEQVSLADLAREAVANAAMSLQKHAIVIVEPFEDLVVVGDRSRLAQVVGNLLDNAIKYSPSGGTIRVALSKRDEHALLSVTDPGIGIPKEEQAMLFERYFRAQNAPITAYGGLGLGLYISRDIVERHGGRISMESEIGQGSTFTMALPLEGPEDEHTRTG